MRKSEETVHTNEGFVQETEENFDLDFHPSPSVEDDDAIQPMSLSDMSRFRGGRSMKHTDKFNTSCGGIIPQ